MEIDLTVNGSMVTVDVEPRTLLVQALRDQLGLTGTKVGLRHEPVRRLHGPPRREGDEELHGARRPGGGTRGDDDRGARRHAHPLQTAFVESDGLQCGFCTPGMIMTSLDLLARESDPDDEAIRHALAGNLCRCTGYHTIVDSVRAGAVAMRAT